MMTILLQLFLFGYLLNVCYTSQICGTNCSSLLSPHPPSLYEKFCCNTDNNGKTIKELRGNSRIAIIVCPDKPPISCQRFSNILNCFKLFKANNSVTLIPGYYITQTSNGSQKLVYCDEDYIDGHSCSQVFQKNNTTPSSGYYKILSNGSVTSIYCDIMDYINTLFLSNCSEIVQKFRFAPSGYYIITSLNGSLITVYCEQYGSNCDGIGGWTRVGYINMSESGATCPSGLSSYNFPNINYPLCDRFHSLSSSCNSAFFSTLGLNYSNVCGQARGYQYRGVDGIYDNNLGSSSLEGAYVDGLSITHGSNPRQHIWTYIAGQGENDNQWEDCPCNTGSSETTPQYVGNDYYCESGVPSVETHNFYYSDPLWDGQQCDYLESPCCTSSKMPWFVKSLNQWTTDDIEFRICSSEGYPDEASPVDLIELYVR